MDIMALLALALGAGDVGPETQFASRERSKVIGCAPVFMLMNYPVATRRPLAPEPPGAPRRAVPRPSPCFLLTSG